jgi:GT2 family glycosyltransferase
MSADARVAVIIVTHNRAEWLRRSVQSVLRQQPSPPTLIVVDNGSTDHTPQVLQEECPGATVIRLSHNTGCAIGSNVGAAAAPHDLLFFMDDDSELAVDAVASAARVLLSDDRIGAVTGTIIEDGRPIRVTETPSHTFINVCHSQGAFRKRAFLAAGMYPSDFFYGAEEMDLSLRLLEAGYDIVFHPGVVLFHGADPRTRRPYGLLEIHRNMLRVVLMRAPAVLLAPWALKKLWDTVMAAVDTKSPVVLVAELLALPRTVLRSLWHRRPVVWKVFAAWRYLATREVTQRDYRDAALLEYPTRLELLYGYLQAPSTARGRTP